jgi:hypothetical protein
MLKYFSIPMVSICPMALSTPILTHRHLPVCTCYRVLRRTREGRDRNPQALEEMECETRDLGWPFGSRRTRSSKDRLKESSLTLDVNSKVTLSRQRA